MKTLSILQIGSSLKGTTKTLEHILSYEDKIVAAKTDLLVMPE
ncbi:MAG: carbon-nitrogen hydrolase family protein, partial [Kordiimonadaceae bacterium]|nr:carbon-nitrogen hydrolase family protein [Kordiimonadaceae bacterium]